MLGGELRHSLCWKPVEKIHRSRHPDATGNLGRIIRHLTGNPQQRIDLIGRFGVKIGPCIGQH
ncbi:hypothetical protein DW66_3541 [Pseudomonas putida]|nr:hypothetical protein DW66_3541 [Pseudomonas putida]